MISIVTAYHNRKNLLINTLKTIPKDFDLEFIVVDDCSSEEHRVEDLITDFPFLKVIRLEKENKWYINPCVVFNIGFKESKGDIVIIQNPECLHIGNILEYSSKITDNEYFSFGCYSIDKNTTESLTDFLQNKTFVNKDDLIDKINLNGTSVVHDGQNGWYNHPIFRPVGYHFCSVITKKNLEELGGFDERFANGIAYDDNEILMRIRRKGLNIKIIDEPFVTHQWHYSGHNYEHLNVHELINKNRSLLSLISRETTWSVNNN